MQVSKIRIALISISDEERDFYQGLLGIFQDTVTEPYVSLCHLKKECRGKTYNGAIIDIATIVCASTAEKEFFFSMQKGLPVMQVRRSPETNEISSSVNQPMADHASGAEALSAFLTSICRHFPARSIRLSERKPISLPIQLSLDASDFPISATTGNISQEGCLILSPLWDVVVYAPIWLAFKALDSHPPIRSTVRWKKEVHEAQKMEMGVQFEELSALQQVKIVELLRSV